MSFSFEFSILPEVNQSILEIERVRGFLEAVKTPQNWLLNLQNEAILLESHHSTHIEGTKLSLNESRAILEDIPAESVNPKDKQELLNYREALNFVCKHLNKDTPITEQLIKELHKMTVNNIANNQAEPGSYRKIQNYVVDLETQKIIYTPPSPSQVPQLMKEFVIWLNKKREFLSPVFIAGIAQIQLVNIHPFVDGNGRAARLLATLILYKKGYDFKRLFSISEYYDRNRPAYYRAIRSVSQNDMNLTSWLEYFVEGLQFQISKIREKAEDIIRLKMLVAQLNSCGLNNCQEKIIGYIFSRESIDNEKCQKLCRLSKMASTRNLTSLVKKNLIKKKDGDNITCYIFSNLVLEMIKNIEKHR